MIEGEVGQYGGIMTLIKNIPINEPFHVYNGYWTGEIWVIDGKRYMYVREMDAVHEITPERENDYLEI